MEAKDILAKAETAYETIFERDRDYLMGLVHESEIGREHAIAYLEAAGRTLEAKTDAQVLNDAFKAGVLTAEETETLLTQGKATELRAMLAKRYAGLSAVATAKDPGASKALLEKIAAKIAAGHQRHLDRLVAQLEAGGEGAEGDYAMKLEALKSMTIGELQEAAGGVIDLDSGAYEALSSEDVVAMRNMIIDSSRRLLVEAKELLKKKRIA